MKQRLIRGSDWAVYVRSIGGQRMVDKMQLALDDRAREATHKEKVQNKLEREEEAGEKKKSLEAAGVLPWREELKAREEQRELDEIKRHVREDS